MIGCLLRGEFESANPSIIALKDRPEGSVSKGPDTVGELKSAEIWVSHMPSLKAKKLGKLTQEKVLLEP